MAAKNNAPVAGTTGYIAPSELRLYQRNPRKGNVGVVAASLKAHGQYRPIVVNIGTHTGRRYEVLAGNHTLKAFRTLAQREPDDPRWGAVSAHFIDVDEDQARRIVLADNRTADGGSYDADSLSDLLGGLNDSIDGLGATGFDFSDLDALNNPPTADPPSREDDVDPPPDPGGGRGAPIISYSIVFDTADEKSRWVDFMNWLKRQQPECTPGERIANYIEDQASDPDTDNEGDPDAD